MAGVTATGFQKKNLDTIRQEIEDSFKAAFGFFINLLPGSVFATIIGIFADREASIWDLAEEVYNAAYPDTADGVNLDNVVRINGVTRLAATKSRVPTAKLFGDVGTLVPSGTQFSVSGNPLAKFLTLIAVTLVAGVNEIQHIAFGSTPTSGSFKLKFRGQTTAAILFSANAAGVQSALNALGNLTGAVVTGSFAAGFDVEFAGVDGKQEQPLLEIVNNVLQDIVPALVTVTVTETTAGVNQGAVDCQATDFGPVDAPIDTLTVIDTPVSGLNSVINHDSVVIGRNTETDAELRNRRAATLAIAGKATVDAIRAAVLNVIGVSGATVFENTAITVVSGRPAKSFEVVVQGGADADIAQTIWDTKPAGIETFGTQTVNALDSQGQARAIKFSRATEVLIYFSLDLTVDVVFFPANGAALAEAAIIAWGNLLAIGADVVVFPQLIAQLNPIPGILDIRVRIDDAIVSVTPGDAAVDDNVVIGQNSIARFDSSRGEVNIL